MSEVIKEIFDLDKFAMEGEKYDDFEGFQINTDKQRISIGINNNQSCCESFGHICSEDDFDDFIGAELRNIVIADTAMNTRVVNLLKEFSYDDEDNAMFVNVETDRGTLQFVLYNSHNGYYGHKARVVSEQLKREEYL